MQAQNRLLTIQISQMQISRLRPMSMVIRKLLILQTIRLRTLSLSRKPLGNGSISLIMPRMLFQFKAALTASPRSMMVVQPSFHLRHLRKKVAAKRLPSLLISSMRMAMNILLVFRVVSSMARKSQTMISRTIKTQLIPLLQGLMTIVVRPQTIAQHHPSVFIP